MPFNFVILCKVILDRTKELNNHGHKKNEGSVYIYFYEFCFFTDHVYFVIVTFKYRILVCQNCYLLEKIIVNINLKIQPPSLYPSLFLKRTTLLVHQNYVSQQKVWMFSLMYWEMGEEVVMAAVETIVMLMMGDLLVIMYTV